jgi:hypothetical protein
MFFFSKSHDEYQSLTEERWNCDPDSVDIHHQVAAGRYCTWHAGKALNLSGVQENGNILVKTMKGKQ